MHSPLRRAIILPLSAIDCCRLLHIECASQAGLTCDGKVAAKPPDGVQKPDYDEPIRLLPDILAVLKRGETLIEVI